MNSIQSLFRQNNPYEQFVQQLVQLESRTKLQLESQKQAESEKKSAIGQVSSSISTFVGTLGELLDPDNLAFQPFSASSSDRSAVRITESDNLTETSSHNIVVNRLASNDIALSQAVGADGNDLSGFGDGSIEITVGDRTETITLETTRDDGEGGTVALTNVEIYEELTMQIRERLGDQVTVHTYRIDDDSVQLSVQSRETGFENRIQLENATGALAEIAGGISHLNDPEELNARFTMDGIEFERSGNLIDDVLDGLTFELLKEDEPSRLTIERDINKARSNINRFVNAFNDLNGTIRDRTFLDTENNRRGALQDMRSIRNLTYNLRQTGLTGMDGAEPGELARLTEIGLGFRNNGSIYIEDSDRLNSMLEERPDEVAELLAGEQSVLHSMKAEAEAYVRTSSGILTSLENGIDQRITRLDNRIASQERYLEQYEERQRAMFNELQLIIERGQDQFNQILNFRNMTGL